ncbi:MAG: extradiol ring-cleavage dioxygenase [Candidatus Leucobacter sulfamidivorax]|jgi:protocatechuate 4,5-dioxygenase alpha chain|nr:extradiol ring-cleavage dioxygenase [Candidatus Leucobacter sulfamidivorax]
MTFKTSMVTNDLVIDLKRSRELRALLAEDEAALYDRYPLTPEEREALLARDFRRLYDLGLHPYLGGQLARLFYGNAAGEAATRAVRKLVESLGGQQSYRKPDGEA